MKLAVEYTIKGTKYRFNIDVEEPNIREELDKMLKEICEKFDGEVERYRVSKIITNVVLQKTENLAPSRGGDDESLNIPLSKSFSDANDAPLQLDRGLNGTVRGAPIISPSLQGTRA